MRPSFVSLPSFFTAEAIPDFLNSSIAL